MSRSEVDIQAVQKSLEQAARRLEVSWEPSEERAVEAPRFFAEGMQQMDLLGYPSQVKRVMQRFFDQWGEGRRMH